LTLIARSSTIDDVSITLVALLRVSRFPLALALAFPVVLAAGCGGDAPPGAECMRSADCRSPLVCLDQRCVAAPDAAVIIGEDAPFVFTDAFVEDLDALVCPPSRACEGTCCDEGATCTVLGCCLEAAACGDDCCGAGERCELDVCLPVCAPEEINCGTGLAAMCCAAGEVCLSDACVLPGDPCSSRRPCMGDAYCEPTLMRCLPRAMTEPCEVRPPPGRFDPLTEWNWTGDPDWVPTHDQVMATPAVASLTDDDDDGDVDRDDIPEVVFHSFSRDGTYWRDGVLRAVRGSDGARMWPGRDPSYRTNPGSGIAIAELDATSPGPEIVTCSEMVGGTGCCDGEAGDLLVIAADGRLIRRIDTVDCGYSAPVIGDMDGDGTPEIAVRYHVVHADGSEVFDVASRASTAVSAGGDFVTMADLDEDGDLELVGGNAAFHHDGTVLWERSMLPDGYPAVADTDMDGRPEVGMVSPNDHAIYNLNGEDGSRVWGPVDVNQGRLTLFGPRGGGPPTIADFDGDGLPEISTAGGYGYAVFENTGAPKWNQDTRDLSSRTTGSSVFDFDGDGAAEVIYSDENYLRVYQGSDGTPRLERCNTTGTLWEYPLVVDVDADDRSEIVVVSNDYGGQTCGDGSPGLHGVRVLGSASDSWVRSRRQWPQHTYHVTDRDDELGVPAVEERSWERTGLNSFRQNVQVEGLFDAPDLVIREMRLDVGTCTTETIFVLRVANVGRAGAPAGVPVVLYDMIPARRMPIAMATTTRRLLPGEVEILRIRVPMTLPPDMRRTYWAAIAPPPMGYAPLAQCRTTNDEAMADVYCPSPPPCGVEGVGCAVSGDCCEGLMCVDDLCVTGPG